MTAAKIYALCPLLLLPSVLSANNGDYRNGPYARLTLQHGKPAELRLEAEQAPWEEVFNEITKTTGARIHYPAPPPGTVSATCVGTMLKQVMECLLAPEADFIFRYADGSQRTASPDIPVEIWVLKTSFGTQQSSFSRSRSTVCKTAEAQDNAAPCEQLKTSAESSQDASDKTAQLLESVNAADAALRADAIASLAMEGRPDDAAVREALYEALSDENPQVRVQAVFGIANREGPAAASALQEAMQDGNAEVRLMAVDSAGENAALLQKALTDSDETVRKLAALKLEALAKAGTDQ